MTKPLPQMLLTILLVALSGEWIFAAPPPLPLENLSCRVVLDPGLQPFLADGTYRQAYDANLLLPFYLNSLKLHVEWAERISNPNPVIIDAGGGTGNIALAIGRARPSAKVFILDVSEPMTDIAIEKGFPRSQISLSDIREMHQPNGQLFPAESADHILSHSVIWNLPDPAVFFAEAYRVLKHGGTLGVSTADHFTEDIFEPWMAHLDHHLSIAVSQGLYSKEQKADFISNNSKLGRNVRTPLSREELIALGLEAGFDLVEAVDAYVLAMPSLGTERPLFNQVLWRKP